MLWDKAKMMWLVADGQQRKSVELHGFQCFLQNACKTVIMKHELLYLAMVKSNTEWLMVHKLNFAIIPVVVIK